MPPGWAPKTSKEAPGNGGSICRIATHCTERPTSIQHFGLARELGLETVGFLMMSHTISPRNRLPKPGSWLMPAASASTWWSTAGALVPEGVPTG